MQSINIAVNAIDAINDVLLLRTPARRLCALKFPKKDSQGMYSKRPLEFQGIPWEFQKKNSFGNSLAALVIGWPLGSEAEMKVKTKPKGQR
jgi:hypothetical protein